MIAGEKSDVSGTDTAGKPAQIFLTAVKQQLPWTLLNGASDMLRASTTSFFVAANQRDGRRTGLPKTFSKPAHIFTGIYSGVDNPGHRA